MFNIIEKFVSIDGEGKTSGELSTFIRFQGCNLRCSWCDTKYSWPKEEIKEQVTAKEIHQYIKSNNTINVTLTGGEPLIQDNIYELLSILNKDSNIKVNIETNGSVNLKKFKEKLKGDNISYILDFKLPSSKMTDKMDMENINLVNKDDVYKFVIGSKEDLEYAKTILNSYDLCNKCKVFFSPVLKTIKLDDIVEFMKINNLNKVKMQVQLHKIIWDEDERGV